MVPMAIFTAIVIIVCALATPTVILYGKFLSGLNIRDPFRRRVVARLAYEANVGRILEEINQSRLVFIESRRALYSLNTLDKPTFNITSPTTGSMRCFPYATYNVRVIHTSEGNSEVAVWESVPLGTIALLLAGAIASFPWTLPLSAGGILIAVKYDFSAIPSLTLHRLNGVPDRSAARAGR